MLVLFLLIVAGFVTSATYNSATQTLLVRKYLKSLAKDLNTTITIKTVDVSFFNQVSITGLYVEDLHQDTLIYIDRLEVDVDEFSFKEKVFIIDNVHLENTFFNLQKYKNEGKHNLNFVIEHFSPKDTLSKNQWQFELLNAKIVNARFNYDHSDFEKTKTGVDFKHIGLTYFSAELNDIEFIPQGVNCNINKMRFFEQSGFQIDDLTTYFNISPKGIMTENLEIKTPYSDIHGNALFLSNTYKDFSNFISEVNIKSYFDSSLVSFRDICYFAPKLDCLNKSLTLTGEIKGRINSLKARKISLLLDDGTSFKGKADISGLPDSENMFLYVNVKELITSKNQMEQLPLYPFTKETFVRLPSAFTHLGKINFKGNFTGFTHDFVAYGKFKTTLGDITTDVAVKVRDDKPYYKGKIQTNHFKMGEFFEIPNELGDITMNVNVDGHDFSKEELYAKLTGNIDQVIIKNYEYNNVEVKGEFQNQIFNGFLAVQDENITFDFDGKVDLTKKLPHFNFISNIKQAKLAKLNFINSKKKLKTRFTTQLKVDLVGSQIDNMVGEVAFLNSFYTDKLDSIYIGNTLISSSRTNEGGKLFKVDSDILDAKVEGKYQFKDLIAVSNDLIAHYIPSFDKEAHKDVGLINDFKFNINLHNTTLLSKILLNGIELSKNSTVSGYYKSANKSFSINSVIPQVNASGVVVTNCVVRARTSDERIYLNLTADKIYKSDTLYIDNFNVTANAANDTLNSIIKWKNKDPKTKTEAKIKTITFFEGYTKNTTKIIDSYAYISDSLWDIGSNNLIENDTTGLAIKNLKITSNAQRILIDGRLTENLKDQLDIVLKDFDLLSLKKVIPKKVIELRGVINGVASLKKTESSLLFTSDLNFDKFKINGKLIGHGDLKSTWNTDKEFLNIDGKFYRDHIPTILFGGNYFPYKEKESLDMNLELYRTDLNLFDIYTKGIVKDLKGRANAKIHLTGSFKEPSLNGTISLLKPSFKVGYLNTKYNAHTFKIKVEPDMISFDNVTFLDRNKNTAVANGTVFHEWFKNINFDMGLSMTNFLTLNTTEKDNKIYYGKAFATGFANISYDAYNKQTIIDVDVLTEKGTVFNIPLDNNEDVVENNFIEFVSNDTSKLKVEVEEDVDLSNIEMNFDLHVTKDAEVRLIFDDQIGDVMRSTGEGDLKLNINNQGELSIYGNYEIFDGDYLFTLQNVINKRFDLEQGGTISWDGSPYDAQLDITAAYRTRARLYDLLLGIDTSDIYKKRIPVDLKLQMRQAMLNPEITFDIDLPTADEDTRSKVRSVLYVSDQEENIQELNKQVFSLLILNRFLSPPNVQSVGGNTGVGAATSSELLSNQLSNWLSRISNDFDIGVNYRPGDELSNQEIELALSTQIFNDRLIIDSNFGLSDRKDASSSSQSANNLIGDVTIEYKVSKDGKVRVKAFNVSNQFSLEEINSPYTQGVGISYKEEFDSFGEFFGKFFGAFKKKIK
jgi:TamB, inner membrane protein subunit of TAM complex